MFVSYKMYVDGILDSRNDHMILDEVSWRSRLFLHLVPRAESILADRPNAKIIVNYTVRESRIVPDESRYHITLAPGIRPPVLLPRLHSGYIRTKG